MRKTVFRANLLTTTALALTMPFLAAATASAQQATPDAGAAVNQASPVTEKILQELRASKPEPDVAPAVEPAPPEPSAPQTAAPTPVIVPEAVPTPAPGQDGALPGPATDAPNTDGQLAKPVDSAPVDGDMAGDGKLLSTPAEASQDPLTDVSPAPIPIRLRPAAAPRRDARAAAGRSRPVVEEPAPARRPAAVEPPSDAALPDAANGDTEGDGGVAPSLRAQIAAEDDENPYAPVGYKIGSFTLMPSITAETVYSDNVRQSQSNRQSDVALVLRPAFTLESDWSRHFVSVDLRGMTAREMHLGDENNRELNVDINGRYDIREGTSLDGEAAYELGKIPHSDPNLPAGATMRPSATTATLGAAINHKINRLALRLHGSVADNDQGDSGGGPIRFRDGTVDTRAAYEVSPSLTLVGTGKRVGRDFNDASGTDAVANEARIGLESDPSAKLSGVFSLGLARVATAHSAADTAGGLVGGANVIWLPSALTTLTFAAASDLGVTDAVGATAIRTTKIGLDVKHEFRRWLSMTSGISETRRTYPGLALAETERSGHFGIEYDLNRTVALTGDIKRTMLASTDAAKAYAEDQVVVGVRLQK